MRKYDRFPKFTAIESFANAGAVYLPLIFISASSPGPQAAYLMLAIRVLQAPLLLLGRAVSQVTQSHLAEWDERQQVQKNFVRVVRNMLSLTIGPVIAMMIVAPYVTEFFFGKKWADVGIYFTLILPNLYMHLINYVFLPLAYFRSKNKIVMLLTIGGSFLRVASVAFAVQFSPFVAALVYSATGFIFYLGGTILYCHFTNIRFVDIFIISKQAVVLTSLFVGMAGIFVTMISLLS